MREIGADERRARLGVLHHLHPDHRAVDVRTATAGMVVMHATDPASVYLGLHARTVSTSTPDIDGALYDDRSIVRVTAMRRTVFAARAEDAVVPFAACSLRVAARERTRLVTQLVKASEIDDPEPWLTRTMAETAATLAEMGSATAQEISAAVPSLKARWDPAPGTKYGGDTPVASRILSQLAMEGVIERDRPTGDSFTSTRFRWRVVDEPLAARALDLGEDEGRRLLVSRWLERFGPGTEADLVWWTGLTKTHIRAALAALDLEPVDLGGKHGFALAGSPKIDDPGPWVALLPGLDPTSMGWRDRDWYLDPVMVPELFDTAGNAGPTVWADGRVVGGWAQRDDREITFELLDDISDDHRQLLEIERARLREFLDDGQVALRFRFPTPLHRRIAVG